MTPQEFDRYAREGYNRIPVIKEVLADLDTPVSAYLKLAHEPYTYLFESVHGGEQWGRYSIIGLPAKEVIRVHGHVVTLESSGVKGESRVVEDPLKWIREFQLQYKVPEIEGMPRFSGGLVGYFGYETIRLIESRLHSEKPDPLGVPDILLMVSEEVVVFDNLRGRLMFVTHADPRNEGALSSAEGRLLELIDRLREGRLPGSSIPSSGEVEESDFVSGFTQAGFEEAVSRVKDYIAAGDVMQVVLSQRMSIPFKAPAIDLYRALRSLNPSPYMFHLDLGGFEIVGSSPEILVRLDEGVVTVRPIAGTRKRGQSTEEDLALEQDLLKDPKEIAEHLMLIDLGRNDAGRVCETGSVKVTDQMIIERYSHVMHIVSNVTGRLRAGSDAFDVLRATFPAGTVSGAPKIRALEIIDELEPVKRGIYAGAVGYIGWAGNLDTAIAIRTAVIQDEVLHIQAGAGVVHDSIPLNEWEETLNKGRAIFRAVDLAGRGLDLG